MTAGREISAAAGKRLKRLEGNNRRRAAQKGQPAERVDFIARLEATGWACRICGLELDPELPPSDPLSISLEHDIALETGGGHTSANVFGAHLICNVEKGQREDAKRAAKIKRQRREKGPQAPHRKKRPIQSRGFQTNKTGPFKQTLDGRVVRRDSQ